MIQRSFDDEKGDDKKLKDQEQFMITKMMTFKNEFKIEFKIKSRTLQGSRANLISRFNDSRIIKIKIQDSNIQESREDLIKISIKKIFKTLSSTRSFLQNHYRRVLLSGNRLPDYSNRLPMVLKR